MNLQFAILQFLAYSLQGYDYAARHIDDRQKSEVTTES